MLIVSCKPKPQTNTIMITAIDSKLNVLGSELISCCMNPITGFYRDGMCASYPNDPGSHIACAVLTKEFLEFSGSCGNDLSTPAPEYGFPGLRPGDQWCLCASRWKEAYDAGKAPLLVLEATHEAMLQIVPLSTLKKYAFKSQ